MSQKEVKTQLNWVLCLLSLGLCFLPASALAAQAASRSRVFLPVMICQSSNRPQSLALYEGETLRGLHYTASPESAVPFGSSGTVPFFKETLERLHPFSPSRALNYQAQLPELLSQIKPIETGELISADSYSQILLPLNCQLKTLAVLEAAEVGVEISGTLDPKLWNQMDRLDQASMILEIFSSAELMLQSEERIPTAEAIHLGSRALAAYTLADSSPLQDLPSRFEIFQRIGFLYAESDIGMCIRLDQLVTWNNRVPISGSAYFSEYPNPRCYFNWNGQKLAADGYFLTSADAKAPHIFALTLFPKINSDQYEDLLDRKLSKLYGQPLYFNNDGNSDQPIRFFDDGSVQSGTLSATGKPVLKWDFAELKIGFPYSSEIDHWFPSEIVFWPNGKPRWIQSAAGKMLIQGQWIDVNSGGILIYENGQIKCADFNPAKTRFKKKNGKPYILTQDNRYTCFDEQGDPIEVEYSSAEDHRAEELKDLNPKF